MPIPKSELTPQWHQPNSRGYNGHSQSFASFAGDEVFIGRRAEGTFNVPPVSAGAAAGGMDAGGMDAARRIGAQIANMTGPVMPEGGLYDTGYAPGAPTGGGLSLKDPKILAIGGAVLLGLLLLTSKKKAT